MTSLSSWTGYQAAWDEQKREDFPTPSVVQHIPGESFTSVEGTSDIKYTSSLLNRTITYSQWRAAGFPLDPTSVGPLVLANPGQLVGVGGRTYRAQSASTSYSIKVGPNYSRFEVRGGDQWVASDGEMERAELARVGYYPRDTDLWGAFDVRVTGDVSKTWDGGGPNISQIFTNVEPGEKNKPPAIAFKITPAGALEVHTRGDKNAITVTTPRTVVRTSIPNANDGRVIHVVYRTRLNAFGGELDVWIDGTRVVRSRDASIGYNDTTDDSLPQFKFGQYRSATSETIVTEFANVDFGTANLLGRVANPLPWPEGY
ncbi:heparin lyase I family protein [Microbacterium lacus]